MLIRGKEDYQKQIIKLDLIEWFMITQPELQLNNLSREVRNNYYKTTLTVIAEPSLLSVKRRMQRRSSSKTGRRNAEVSTKKGTKL